MWFHSLLLRYQSGTPYPRCSWSTMAAMVKMCRLMITYPEKQLTDNTRKALNWCACHYAVFGCCTMRRSKHPGDSNASDCDRSCLLYTSDAADERSSVDLGGR